VGSPYEDNYQGCIYVYIEVNNNWVLQQKLSAPNNEGAFFGKSIAISYNGSLIAGGSPYSSVDTKFEIGCGFLFRKNGDKWGFQQKLVSIGHPQDNFGIATAMSSDGSVLAFGCWNANSGPNVVYVYMLKGNVWVLQQSITTGDLKFGNALALSSDGSKLIIGAFLTVFTFFRYGTAYAYVRNSSNLWVKQKQFLPNWGTSQPNCEFGVSVSVSEDGSTVAVGADMDNTLKGSFYVFYGDQWSKFQQYLGDGSPYDRFGYSVSLSIDANLLLIGAYNATSDQLLGSVYVYQNS